MRKGNPKPGQSHENYSSEDDKVSGINPSTSAEVQYKPRKMVISYISTNEPERFN